MFFKVIQWQSMPQKINSKRASQQLLQGRHHTVSVPMIKNLQTAPYVTLSKGCNVCEELQAFWIND